MTFSVLTWLFVLTVAVHNLEEATWLPAWSQRIWEQGRRWHRPVGASEFRFAVVVLTAAAAAAALAANIGGKESLGTYLVCGYALAMLLNVLFPHVLASLVMRAYAPGSLRPSCSMRRRARCCWSLPCASGMWMQRCFSEPAHWSCWASPPLSRCCSPLAAGCRRQLAPARKPRGAHDREIGHGRPTSSSRWTQGTRPRQ